MRLGALLFYFFEENYMGFHGQTEDEHKGLKPKKGALLVSLGTADADALRRYLIQAGINACCEVA